MTMATAAATVVGAAITADAMKGGGVQQAGTSTVRTEAPEYMQGVYSGLAADIEDIRGRGLLQDIQTYSPFERALIEQGMQRAQAGSPFQAAGDRAVAQILGGGLLSEAADMYRQDTGPTMDSQAFQDAAQRQVDLAMRPITSQFAAGGRLGSGAFADALGSGVTGALSPMMLTARQQDISTDLNRAAGIAGLAGQEASSLGLGIEAGRAMADVPFQDIQRGLGFGGLLSAEDYAKSQSRVTGAQRLADLARGATVGEQTTQPLYAPNTGDMAGAFLMQNAPQIGQAFGQLGQGVYNAASNFFAPKPLPSPVAAGSTGVTSAFSNPMGSYTPAGAPIGGGNLNY